eukprot:scaffold173516_cov27-Tisochrysis_lutea.AAC.11
MTAWFLAADSTPTRSGPRNDTSERTLSGSTPTGKDHCRPDHEVRLTRDERRRRANAWRQWHAGDGAHRCCCRRPHDGVRAVWRVRRGGAHTNSLRADMG